MCLPVGRVFRLVDHLLFNRENNYYFYKQQTVHMNATPDQQRSYFYPGGVYTSDRPAESAMVTSGEYNDNGKRRRELAVTRKGKEKDRC